MSELATKTITIEKGRDKGKTFLITEMPINDADRFARRVALAVMRSGMRMTNVELINFQSMSGIMELLKFGITAFGYMDEDLALELTDQLIDDCVQIIPSGGIPRKMVDGDIRDLTTKFRLRLESFKVHGDFLTLGESLT